MAGNILNASAPLVLDGRELVVRYRALAFISYAEATGRDLLLDLNELKNAAEAMRSGEGGSRILVMIRDLLWAGLIDQQPEITRDDAARMFSLADFEPISLAIMGALKLTMPEAKPGARPMRAAKGRDSRQTNGRDYGLSLETHPESRPESSGG